MTLTMLTPSLRLFSLIPLLGKNTAADCSVVCHQAFVVETPVDGNEPVRLHHQDVQVARDEQEDEDEVLRTEVRWPAGGNIEGNVENEENECKNESDNEIDKINMVWLDMSLVIDGHPELSNQNWY